MQAKLIGSKHIGTKDQIDGELYTMRTEKALRGQIDETFQVWQENSSGRATFDWKAGESYLLFLYTKYDRGWALDGCGNSGPLANAQLPLREIAHLSQRRGGTIQVSLGGDWIAGGALPNVEVDAQGLPGSFFASTNEKGVAEIHVPAGQYSVTVPNAKLVPFDLSYDDPRTVVIENGSCVQIQYVERSDRK